MEIPDYPHYIDIKQTPAIRSLYYECTIISSKSPNSETARGNRTPFLYEHPGDDNYFSRDEEGQERQLDIKLVDKDENLKKSLLALLFPQYSSLGFWERRSADGTIKSSGVYSVSTSKGILGYSVIAPRDILLYILDANMQSILGAGVNKRAIASGLYPGFRGYQGVMELLPFADQYGCIIAMESGPILNVDRTDDLHFYIERLAESPSPKNMNGWLIVASSIITVKFLRALIRTSQ